MRLQEGSGGGGGVEITESLHQENKRDGELSQQLSKEKGSAGGAGGQKGECNYKPAAKP